MDADEIPSPSERCVGSTLRIGHHNLHLHKLRGGLRSCSRKLETATAVGSKRNRSSRDRTEDDEAIARGKKKRSGQEAKINAVLDERLEQIHAVTIHVKHPTRFIQKDIKVGGCCLLLGPTDVAAFISVCITGCSWGLLSIPRAPTPTTYFIPIMQTRRTM